MIRPLSIAMLTHSTNPRGGVVHAMQLSEALTALGHRVTLHAPDAKGSGFFRSPACRTATFPVAPAVAGMTAMVEQRIDDYLDRFSASGHRGFDLYHAHDGISGNALATLKERGLIPAYARTVHHVDDFADPRLTALQARAIDNADAFFTVSDLWRNHLGPQRQAVNVGNGVDIERFRPPGDALVSNLARRLGLGTGPVFLVVGGIEQRKNTARILDAFLQVRTIRPDAQLVIAGGVSLLDHRTYQSAFAASLAKAGASASSVHIAGAVADEDMPALYRLADALVFASVKEGFGLCVLEAMASDLPVVVSSIAPFTGYLERADAVWCDPYSVTSIAGAMTLALQPEIRRTLIARGRTVAARHSWAKTAAAHLPAYERLGARTYA